MAGRPIKQGIDYFPFDVNFYSDVKVRKIAKACGPNSVAVIISLLCNIYRKQGYYILWDDDLPFFIADEVGVSEGCVREVIKKALQVGFFDVEKHSAYGILTSAGIQRRFFEIIKRRTNIEIKSEYLINVCNNSINVCNNSINVCNNSINVCNNSINVCNNSIFAYKNPTTAKEEKTKKESAKEKNKKEENNTTPTTACAYACEEASEASPLPTYEKLLASSLRSQEWLETLAMNYHMGVPILKGLLHDFLMDNICRGFDDKGKTLRDFKSHFNNWLLVRLRVEKEQQEKQRDNGDRQGNGAAATFEQRRDEAADLVARILARNNTQAVR